MTKTYCDRLLMGLIGNYTLVTQWWNSPNRAFEGRLPKDVPLDEVVRYLEGHCFG